MAKNCICCCRSIGFFSGEYRITEESGLVYCDSCFNEIQDYVRVIKNADKPETLQKAYAKLKEIVAGMSVPENRLSFINEEIDNFYQRRLPEATAAYEAYCRENAAQIQEEEEQRRQEEAEERAREEKEAQRKRTDMLTQLEYAEARTMPATTCESIPGFRIVEHLGMVSGISSSMFINIRETTFTATNYYFNTSDLLAGRAEALAKLKEHAHELGGNAVTGVRYETVTSGETALMIVCADGNAVIVEPE